MVPCRFLYCVGTFFPLSIKNFSFKEKKRESLPLINPLAIPCDFKVASFVPISASTPVNGAQDTEPCSPRSEPQELRVPVLCDFEQSLNRPQLPLFQQCGVRSINSAFPSSSAARFLSSRVYMISIETWRATDETLSFCLFIYWPYRTAFGILAPRPGIKSMPPAVEAQSPNH